MIWASQENTPQLPAFLSFPCLLVICFKVAQMSEKHQVTFFIVIFNKVKYSTPVESDYFFGVVVGLSRRCVELLTQFLRAPASTLHLHLADLTHQRSCLFPPSFAGTGHLRACLSKPNHNTLTPSEWWELSHIPAKNTPAR